MRRKTLQADIARALGISRQRVHVLAKRGMPVHSVEAARAWRAEHLDADAMKPDPRARRAAPDPDQAELKRRLLRAEVAIREQKARNSGSIELPSVRVERGLMHGLQLLRAGLHGATAPMYAELVTTLGDKATRAVLARVEGWWASVHDAACEAILAGFARELPAWGRDFHQRWVSLNRGNFPDRPYPGEPRPVDEVLKGDDDA